MNSREMDGTWRILWVRTLLVSTPCLMNRFVELISSSRSLHSEQDNLFGGKLFLNLFLIPYLFINLLRDVNLAA